MATIFEKIIAGEIPSKKVYEDEDFLCILDINPKSKGHCVMFPKILYETYLDMPDDLMAKFMMKIKEVSNLLKDKLSANRVNLIVDGIEVPHFHMHLIPRYEKDNFKLCVSDYEKKDLKEIYEKIKNWITFLCFESFYKLDLR